MSQPLNIRNVDEATIIRLGEQAAAEGVSLSEWVRQLLDRSATLLSPAELAARRTTLAATAQPPDEFARYYEARMHRRPYVKPKAS
jgi:plasmid stability protein